MLTCDPGICVNYCEWKTPTMTTCKIDIGSHYGDNVLCNGGGANLIYQGESYAQMLTNCNIRINSADFSLHSGIWTCTTNIKTAGKFVDTTNLTFVPEFGGAI